MDYSFRRYPDYKEKSRERLSSILKKKIQTTMIGSLSSIEEHFGFLWEGDTEEHKKMGDLFQKIRSEVLDKGNHQARNIDVELSQYEIEWLRNTLHLQVKQKGDKHE
jgi:hypothetical protein